MIKPFEVTLSQVKRSLTTQSESWWKSTDNDNKKADEEEELSQWQAPTTDWKKDSKVSSQVTAVAKKHHMVTDVLSAPVFSLNRGVVNVNLFFHLVCLGLHNLY